MDRTYEQLMAKDIEVVSIALLEALDVAGAEQLMSEGGMFRDFPFWFNDAGEVRGVAASLLDNLNSRGLFLTDDVDAAPWQASVDMGSDECSP